MPLVKRTVEPTHISRGVIDTSVRNELECVANSTMANIIRQLSSLSAHAEDLFSELHRETCFVFQRCVQLNDRVDRLKTKVTQLNPTVEEVSLQDINMRKPFRSSVIKDQQIATLETRPLAIIASYQQCDAPPPLNKLNPYREDGKDSLKFYTDPGYFFELWCQEMAKDSDAQARKHRHRNRKARPNKEPKTIRAPKSHLDELSMLKHGPELAETLRRTNKPAYDEGTRRPNSIEISQSIARTPSSASQQHRTSEYGYIFQNGSAVRTGKEAGGPKTAAAYAASLKRPDSTISDSGYFSTGKNSDYQVPAQRGSESSLGPLSPTSRPMVPPPAPPPSSVPGRPSTDRTPLHANLSSPPGIGSGAAQRTPSVTGGLAGRALGGRESLPPPPPTPLVTSEALPTIAEYRGVAHVLTGVQENRPRDSFDLPLPPMSPSFDAALPSPPSDLRNYPAVVPPPPPPSPPIVSPLPLPPDDIDPEFTLPAIPPPPPPPMELHEPPSLVVTHSTGSMAGSDTQDRSQPDTVSECSDVSSLAASSTKGGPDAAKAEQTVVRDTRSDLLAAIREGFKLRKVEERRLQSEKKQQTTTGLDVQSIMEAAFERRRRALEENDSDHDGDEDAEDNWEDD